MASREECLSGQGPTERRHSHSGGVAVGFELEERLRAEGKTWIAGIDEVGRGPLAGPVLAVALILPPGCIIEGATDSKRLSARVREELAREIEGRAFAVGIGAASAREVDEINVLRATELAMRRAVANLPVRPDHLIVDGLPVPGLGEQQTAVVSGDQLVHMVSCASIVAKVTRDRLMKRLARRYPEYGWERNSGYGTRAHLEALARLGPTPHHRRSYAPVQLALKL